MATEAPSNSNEFIGAI